MTKKKAYELCEALKRLCNDGFGERYVFLSSDEEGNEYHPLWSSFPVVIGNRLFLGLDFEYVKNGKNRLPRPTKVKELRKEMEKGLNKRFSYSAEINLSDDDECNGFHGCYESFQIPIKEMSPSQFFPYEFEDVLNKVIILG